MQHVIGKAMIYWAWKNVQKFQNIDRLHTGPILIFKVTHMVIMEDLIYLSNAIKHRDNSQVHRKNSIFQTKYPNNLFCFGAPGAQIGPFENLDPMGRPLRFSLNFVYTVYMAIGKIWLKEPHRQMSPRAPEGPSKFMNHGFCPMDE